MSQLNVNTITTLSGTDITIPTGKKLVVTDSGGLSVPGTVVQIQNTQSNTQYTANNIGVLTYLYQVAITPKFSNSKFLVHFNTSGVSNGGSGRLALRIRHNETSGDNSGTQIMDCQLALPGAGTSHLTGGGASVLVNSVGNTNTQYFKVCAYKNDTTTTWYVNQYNSYSGISVMEIAQ